MGFGDIAALANPLSAQAMLAGKVAGRMDKGVAQQQTAELDPDTKALMAGQRGEAAKTLDETAAESMQGAESAGGALQPQASQFDQQSTALGMANPADLSQVLQKRANKKYSSDIIKLQNKSKLEAGDRMNERQKMAMQNLQAQNALHQEKYNNALANEKAKKAARGQMLGSVLGIAGTLGGMAAGGAGGAKVGGAAGSGLGQAAG